MFDSQCEKENEGVRQGKEAKGARPRIALKEIKNLGIPTTESASCSHEDKLQELEQLKKNWDEREQKVGMICFDNLSSFRNSFNFVLSLPVNLNGMCVFICRSFSSGCSFSFAGQFEWALRSFFARRIDRAVRFSLPVELIGKDLDQRTLLFFDYLYFSGSR